MKVLVIGKGGREHALCWKLKQSPRVHAVFCAPGNAGTSLDAQNIAIDPNDTRGLIQFAKREGIGLTVVGPEEPLTLGIVDAFQREGLRIFGPRPDAAELEGLMDEHDIGVNIHNETYLSFENRVCLHLAAGHLVVSEPLSPQHGLEHGLDYIPIGTPDGLAHVLEMLRRFPRMWHGVRVRGRQKAEQYAELTGRTLGDVVEIREQLTASPPMPYAVADAARAEAVPLAPGSATVTVTVGVGWSLN